MNPINPHNYDLIYAQNHVSREMLTNGRSYNHEVFDPVFVLAYLHSYKQFQRDHHFIVTNNGTLLDAATLRILIKSDGIDGDIPEASELTPTNTFYRQLVKLNTWRYIVHGKFDLEVMLALKKLHSKHKLAYAFDTLKRFRYVIFTY